MNAEAPYFKNPPIIEAVLDIDCDMPPGFSVESHIAKAQALYKDCYPKIQKRCLKQQKIKQSNGKIAEILDPVVEVQALLLAQADGKQLVQIRSQGYSFNKLAPYTTLNDYLAEIQRTWELFRKEFKPIQVQRIRLRCINRILLPLDAAGKLDLDAYLLAGPRLPDDTRMDFTDFLNQHQVVEKNTGNQAKIILASQPPVGTNLPIIFDIEATKTASFEPEWRHISGVISSLRDLKNHIFRRTLTPKCTHLFQ